MTWDEKTISEHDKERGTRRIINEPKTPYNRLGIPESKFYKQLNNQTKCKDPEEEMKDTREELLKRLLELQAKSSVCCCTIYILNFSSLGKSQKSNLKLRL